MTSPTFVNKATGGNSTAANVTVNVPASTVDDDLLIIFLSKDDTAAVTWPGGWTIITENTANSFYGGVGWKRASGEPANYTWTFTSTWRDAIMLAYRGVAQAAQAPNPLDPDTPPAATTSVANTGSQTWATNNITTLTTDTIAVALFNYIGTSGWGADPSGWTARQNAGGNEVYAIDQAFTTPQTITGPTANLAGGGGAVKGFILALQSAPDDQHYFPPPVFPGVRNLDARRMI